jgi:hypothetical protein
MSLRKGAGMSMITALSVHPTRNSSEVTEQAGAGLL